jgi:ABC-type bacteriocin/lantibiotic exporter with double-glycine peptidase domain
MIVKIISILSSIFFILKKNEKKKALIFICFSFFCNFLEFFGFGFLLIFLKFFFDNNLQTNDKFYFIFEYIKDFGVDINFFLLIMIISFFILKNLFLMTYNWYFFGFVSELKKKLHYKILQRYILNKISSISNESQSNFYRNFEGASTIQTVILTVNMIFSEILISLLLITLLIIASPYFAILFLFLILAVMFVYNFQVSFYLQKIGVTKSTIVNFKEKIKLIILLGYKDIKLHQKENYFLNLFLNNSNKYFDIERKSLSIRSFFRNICEIFLIILIFLYIFYYHNFKYENSESAIFLLGFFSIVLLRILPALVKIFPGFQTIIFHEGLIKNYIKSMKLQKIREPNVNNLKLLSFNKSLLYLENISYEHKNKNKIISELNLTLQKNQTIGIYGKSGCGKTTLLDLISGIRFPKEGNIFSEGVNIHKSLSSWLAKVSYIPQEPFFLDDTIAANVAFGTDKRDIDLKLALKCLKLSEFINTADSKKEFILNRHVGKNGNHLSGGQKQRLALARSLYKNSRILLLDEFTNALDQKTEKKIIKTILKLKSNRLIFIVSHNLDILKKCDYIYEFKNFSLESKKVIKKLR